METSKNWLGGDLAAAQVGRAEVVVDRGVVDVEADDPRAGLHSAPAAAGLPQLDALALLEGAAVDGEDHPEVLLGARGVDGVVDRLVELQVVALRAGAGAAVEADGGEQVTGRPALAEAADQHVADVGLARRRALVGHPGLLLAHTVVVVLLAAGPEAGRVVVADAVPDQAEPLVEPGVGEPPRRVALPVGGEPVLVPVDGDRRRRRGVRRNAQQRQREERERDGQHQPHGDGEGRGPAGDADAVGLTGHDPPKDQKRSATPGSVHALTMVSTRDEQPELCTRSVHVCDHRGPPRWQREKCEAGRNAPRPTRPLAGWTKGREKWCDVRGAAPSDRTAANIDPAHLP